MPVGFMFISRNLPRFTSPGTFARNTVSPQATAWQHIAGKLGHALRWRRKQLFAWNGTTTWLGKGGATRERWRFRARTGTLAGKIAVRMHIALVDGTGTDPYVEIVGTPVGGGTTVTLTLHAGAGSTVANDVTAEGYFGYLAADCSPECAYEFTATEHGSARLVSACVFEESLLPQTDNGYPEARWTVGSPISDLHRQQQLAVATVAYKLNSAHLFCWAVNQYTAPKTNATTTTKNIISNDSTVSAATPGFYVNLVYCNTVAQTEVPVEFAVYAKQVGGTSGTVHLLNSAGSASISITGITTEGWYTATGTLPATEAKYDVAFVEAGGGTISVWGATLAMHDP
jgi:hypothetical protein